MPKLIMLNHKVYELGDMVTLNEEGERRGIGPAGLMVQLYDWHPDEHKVIGLYCEDSLSNWGTLDGEVSDQHGWWINIDELDICVVNPNKNRSVKIINKSLNIGGIELKGKECKLLCPIQNTDMVFVEFNEDVNGCSADGLGKRGYCLGVPTNVLKDVKVKSKS